LLKADRKLNLFRSAQKTMAMDQILLPWMHLNRHNMARHARRKRHFSRRTICAILRHEQRPAADHSLERAKESAATAKLRMRRHLDGTRHPR
jgi:hypothetical protein